MGLLKMVAGERLICDPCYIKNVSYDGEPRFDALKCVKVLHDGDDGEYVVSCPIQEKALGVDSGRIWVMEAEFDCDVEEECLLSGYMRVPNVIPLEEIVIDNLIEEE